MGDCSIPDYLDLIGKVSLWWNCAGEKAREEFLSELAQRTHLPGTAPGLKSDYAKLNMDFCLDCSNNVYELGNRFVYAWVTEKGQIFYIGCGTLFRACNFSSRESGFKLAYNANKCQSYILCAHVREEYAMDIETLCIWYARLRGCTLSNKQKQLTENEIEYFRARKANEKIENDEKTEKKYQKYEQLYEEWPEIIESFNKLQKYCLDVLLSDVDMVSDKSTAGVWVNYDEPTVPRKAIKYCYTIDGVTKAAVEWCKIYGVSPSLIFKRIEKYGMTPKEALTAPPVPVPFKRSALEYYHTIGLIPGSDTSSYVTPPDQWPDRYIKGTW